MTDDVKQIDNWEVHFAFVDEAMTIALPTIKGMVGNKPIRNGALLWFDLEERLGMTAEEVFKIGKPNERWMMMFLASGRSIEDLEIKGTNH